MEKPLPFNIECEQGLLGSIIIDPEVIVEVANRVLPDDFYREAHRLLYRTILRLYESREPADYLTICDELERRDLLESVGGASYITSLVNHVPTSGNAPYYAKRIVKYAQLRRLLKAAGDIAALAYEGQDDALERAESLILSIGHERTRTDFVSISEYLPTYMEHVEQRQSDYGKIRGIPTCLGDLDYITGGLQRGGLYIPAARPGVGKTTLSQNIAYNTARYHGKRVAFFSLEMSLDDLTDRFMSLHTNIDSQHLRNGRLTEDQERAIVRAQAELEDVGIYLQYTPGITLDSLKSKARWILSRVGIDLIIVDYLQLVTATIDGKRVAVREMEVAEVARGLKALAGELNVPVLAPAQINRELERRAAVQDKSSGLSYRMPQLSDLRESGEIEQSADVVMFLARSEETKERVKLLVAKHRNGPEGDIDMQFHGSTTRFTCVGEEQ